MTKRASDEDFICGEPGGEGTDPDLADQGVEIRRTPSGAAIVPRAVGRLQGAAAEAVAALQRTAFDQAEVQQRLNRDVLSCREHGVSWSAIGWSLGTTGDGARKRWSDD